jgi:hypothetical protein
VKHLKKYGVKIASKSEEIKHKMKDTVCEFKYHSL